MKKIRIAAGLAAAVAAAAWCNAASAAPLAGGAGQVVVLPPQTQEAPVDRRGEVQQAVQAWKLAWELGDADTYLRFYDPAFKGDAGSRQQWEKQRRARLANRDIAVRLEQVRTRMLGDGEAEVQFVQHYTSGGHRDVGAKRVQMKRVGGAWRITGERWKARRT